MSNMILVADFLAAISAVARQTIENANVSVYALRVAIGKTDTASIDWNATAYGVEAVIYFPSSLDPLGKMTQDLADAWAAYWVHEIGHALYTDKPTWVRSVQEGISGTVNALEDVRIEGLLSSRGVAANAKKLLEALCNSKLEEARVKTRGAFDFVRNFEGFLCYGGREALLGYALGGFWAEGLAALPAPYAALALDTMARLKACRSTEDVRLLAHWLRGELGNMPQEPEEGEGEGEKGEGEKGEGEGQPGDGKAQQGEKGEGEAQPGEDKGEGKGEGKGEDKGEKGEGDIADNKPGRGAGSSEGEPELTADLAPEGTGTPGEGEPLSDMEKYIAAEVMSQSAQARVTAAMLGPRAGMGKTSDLPLTSKLDRDVAALVKAPAKTTRTHHRDHGRLSRRDTARVLQGAKDVFMLREFTPAKNAAVMLLVDMSSSMAGRNAKYAEQGARMLTRAIERAGGLVCVAGFVDTGPCLALRVVKPFGKRAVACDSSALLNSQGGTPMSPAIVKAAKMLREERSATRRVLLVLTDGACNLGHAGTRFASRYAATLGVEVAAIGIGCDPGTGFPLSVAAANIKTLGEQGLSTLSRTLKSADAA